MALTTRIQALKGPLTLSEASEEYLFRFQYCNTFVFVAKIRKSNVRFHYERNCINQGGSVGKKLKGFACKGAKNPFPTLRVANISIF